MTQVRHEKDSDKTREESEKWLGCEYHWKGEPTEQICGQMGYG